MNGAAPSFPILGVGSSKIGVERSWGGESTLQYDGDWLLVEASGHAAYIDDYIYFFPQPPGGPVRPAELHHPRTAARCSRSHRPTRSSAAASSASTSGRRACRSAWQAAPRGCARSRPRERAPLALIPADRYWLAGRYYFPDTRVSGRGYVELNGRRWRASVATSRSSTSARRPPAYVLLGAGAGVEFVADRRIFRLSLVGTNLLNRPLSRLYQPPAILRRRGRVGPAAAVLGGVRRRPRRAALQSVGARSQRQALEPAGAKRLKACPRKSPGRP
jgi:iron complex outermembrane receptor protein